MTDDLRPGQNVRRLVLCALLAVWAAFVPHAAVAWDGSPSPHDGHHLIVVRSGAFVDSSGKSPLARDVTATFGGKAASIAGPLEAPLTITHRGLYAPWFRLSQPRGHQTPLKVEVIDDHGDVVAHDTVNQGRGSATTGGHAGHQRYVAAARRREPGGGRVSGVSDPPRVKDDDVGENVADDLERELGDDSTRELLKWTHLLRIESVVNSRPAMWWRAGDFQLDPGTYTLRVTPTRNAGRQPPYIDCAIFTTNTLLAYPFQGDVDAPPASYVRFRIDDLPESGEGLKINVGILHHRYPNYMTSGSLTPQGVDAVEATPYLETGYTRWFRLQDIETVPGFGGAEVSLTFNITSGDREFDPVGATQFAIFPHDDRVVRTIDWNAPSGRQLTVVMDFEGYLHRLRTHRDHARVNYEHALAATENRVFPITRPPMVLTNGWGNASGPARDYMLKTLRLLGMNAVSTGDAADNRRRYGWQSAAGHYWPPAWLPFDEQLSYQKYDSYYRDYFGKQPERYDDVAVFQIADEPGEIMRDAMSAPVWRYYTAADQGGERWHDHSGAGLLATKRVDYHDCVLEMTVSKLDKTISFSVARDDALDPDQFGTWTIGKVAYDPKFNLSVKRNKVGAGSVQERRGASVGKDTRVRIVYQGDRAALLIGDSIIHTIADLPERGGFAIEGPQKSISSLRIRPIEQDERITAPEAAPGEDFHGVGSELEKLDMTTLEESGDDAQRFVDQPFAQFVDNHWLLAGGKPEAHAAFREYLKQLGFSPGDFGADEWEAIRPMTLRSLAVDANTSKLYYWSRRFSGMLTPKMFGMAADAIHRHAPNEQMKGLVALSGHSLYFPSAMPLDMFAMGEHGGGLTPGISDWMSLGGWRWDSHQAVAYSVAPYNSGARRYGEAPRSFPMMHCVWPSVFRSHTMLANQVKVISYWTYGPSYAATEGSWSDSPGSHRAVHLTNNRVAQMDDLIGSGVMRPSRVAMLYARSTEYWNAQSAFADRRAAFLALSHEYYQPELVTEEQIEAGALEHYDALYVLDPWVKRNAQSVIAKWTDNGGVLWTCANALTFDEYNEPTDLLAVKFGIERTFPGATTGKPKTPSLVMRPTRSGEFVAHHVSRNHMPDAIAATDATVRGEYGDDRPAWIEKPVGKGRLVYLGHRCGLTYTSLATRLGGRMAVWGDTGRASLVQPLVDANVPRELVLSQPIISTGALTSDAGTVVPLFNMQPRVLEGVMLELRERKRPDSVQIFIGASPRDLPFTWDDGVLRATLPDLDHGGQFVVIRHGRAPADNRLADMEANARKLLASTDPDDLSAGIWMAGFFPDWGMEHKLRPFITHEHWAVRRAAAESLWRLADRHASNLIAIAIDGERDAHVFAEMVHALAVLGNHDAPQRMREAWRHDEAYVRQRSMKTAREWIEAPSRGSQRDVFIDDLIAAALVDPDPAVRATGIAVAAAHRPSIAIKRLTASFADKRDADHTTWLRAVASDDSAFALWWQTDAAQSPEALFAFAEQRRDGRLAKAVLASLTDDKALAHPRLAEILMRQGDDELTQLALTHVDKLSKQARAQLPLVLAQQYDARFGNVIADWQQYFESRRAPRAD